MAKDPVRRFQTPGAVAAALARFASGRGDRLWLGFNDEKGRYADNHLGKGRRHELDPLWLRIEVVRTIVD